MTQPYAATGSSITGIMLHVLAMPLNGKTKLLKQRTDHVEWSCATSTITCRRISSRRTGRNYRQACYLCNISEDCERLGIGDKGTRLPLSKPIEIIPKVINVIERLGIFHIPETCPVSPFPQRSSWKWGLSGTRTLHAQTATALPSELKKFRSFRIKEGVNIDGLSEQTVQKFIKPRMGFVNMRDFFHLGEHAPELRTMEGWE